MWYLYLSKPPFSQLETACRVTPMRDANCSCVRPAPMRTAFTLSPNSIRPPPYWAQLRPGEGFVQESIACDGASGTTPELSRLVAGVLRRGMTYSFFRKC